MIFFDSETDGLLEDLTKVHCIRAYDYEKHAWSRFDQDNLPVELGVKMLNDAPVIVAHNAIDFDVPALKKVYPWFEPKKVIDTLVYARLVFGDLKEIDWKLFRQGRLPGDLIGKHSLKAYGHRIGLLKGTYGETSDWQKYTKEMGDYCERDTEVMMKLWDYLVRRQPSPEALDLEHRVQWVISRQVRFGFPFNVGKAEKLYATLIEERRKVIEECERTFPPFYKWDSKIFTPARDNRRMGYVQGAPMCKVKLETFNPTSGQHVYVFLRKKYGWEPEEFTEKSEVPRQWRHLFTDLYQEKGITGFPEPKIDDDILGALDYPEAPLLAKAAMLQKRIGQIAEGKQSWLKLYNYKTRRIHGQVNTMGAVTRRMAHFKPNVSQVVSVDSPYGKECRECFEAPRGWVVVGADASSLELRMLGHFLAPHDGGAFAKAAVEGKSEDGTDVHTRNAKVLELSRRDGKTWFYAFIYGAGNGKLGKICKGSMFLGKKMRDKFVKGIPGFKKLLEGIEEKVKERGYLMSLDKQKLPVRSLHSALNTLLQSAGAVVMKRALVILDDALQYIYTPGTDYEFMVNSHDEWQIAVNPNTADPDLIGGMATDAITAAGQWFNLRCPLTGEYKVGKNWKETH